MRAYSLHECFTMSKYWKDYDVFYRQKVIYAAVTVVDIMLILPRTVRDLLAIWSGCL